MPEWLIQPWSEGTEAPANQLAAQLLMAFGLGCLVALIYHISQRKHRNDSAPLATTVVLLTILIAMVTMVIGNSVARAFSLVGALAIVRFRTVVEDTRDTAFVIFAVVIGMAVGAGYLRVALVGMPIVAGAALLLSFWGAPISRQESTLTVRLGIGHDPNGQLREVLGRHCKHQALVATGTARQGSALDLTYSIRLRDPNAVLQLITEMNQIQGIQEVEVRQR
jgi:hypothetical protein